MTSLDSSNCSFLHELADKYDCPPLKLAAWKMLQHQVPDTGGFPNLDQLQRSLAPDGQRRIKGTGLTGPGDPTFSQMGVKRSQVKLVDRNTSEYDGDDKDGQEEGEERSQNELPSVFDDFDHGAEEENHEDLDVEPIEIENLEANSSATEVIMAWSRRLKGKRALRFHCWLQSLS